jgi:hypothetical protein
MKGTEHQVQHAVRTVSSWSQKQENTLTLLKLGTAPHPQAHTIRTDTSRLTDYHRTASDIALQHSLYLNEGVCRGRRCDGSRLPGDNDGLEDHRRLIRQITVGDHPIGRRLCRTR